MFKTRLCHFQKVLVSTMLSGIALANPTPLETGSESSQTITKSNSKSVQSQNAKSRIDSTLTFQVFSDSPADEALILRLNETQTFSRMSQMIETNIKLSPPVHVLIKHTKEAQFVATELEKASYIVTLPFSFLHTLFQALSSRYEHQPEVINTVFSASVEFYVWSELANYLIERKRLDAQGDKYTAIDNFASIMMLNQNNAFSDYLADASEAYLLIHTTSGSRITQQAKNELEQDQQRYKHIICLTIGFDQLQESPDTEQYNLSNFYWDEEKITQCKTNYSAIVNNWYHAIQPVLKKKNLISHWVK